MGDAAIAVITARGGSKGLPRKNALPLGGRPLIAHTIAAALDSGCFATVVVTTDDSELAEISTRAGAELVHRPAHLATDGASSLDALRHALCERPGHQLFALLQPTSPLRTAHHVREAFALLASSAARTCVAITAMHHPPQKCLVKRDGRFVPLFDHAQLTAPRQRLEPTFRVNGAIYLGYVDAFLASNDLFEQPLSCYEMSELDAVDIDSADDLALAEFLHARRASRP